LVLDSEGNWQAGIEAWDGNLTILNTNETELMLVVNLDGEVLFEQTLTPYEVFNLASFPPGNYEFHFQFSGDQDFDLTCKIQFERGTRVSFAALGVGMAVSREGFTPQTSADLNAETSPICGGS
jgi:hypothetical protein